jgi:hypothetical protein
MCFYSPTIPLADGTYQWRVRAMINGVWKAYSAYITFYVVTPPIPKAGFWKGGLGDTDFYVTPNNSFVTHYKFYIDVPACNIYGQTLTIDANVPINADGSYIYYFTNGYFSGTFNSATSESGHFGLTNYYIQGCGPISGAFYVSHHWQNSSQPGSINSGTFTLTPGDAALHPGSVFTLQK